MIMQDNGKKPALRFKGFTDPWEQRKLSDIVEKVTEKNAGLQYIETFTNSAEFGIISQRDFFDHDISKIGSLDGYYVVHNEDFVYNPRISVTAPVGPINRNKLGRTGVMSPLYTVFRPHDIDTTYLEHFFKSGYWHSFMNFNGDSGARSDRFSIKDSVFFEMPIPTPDIEEQKKIGEFLTQLDTLITLHQRKYEKLVNIKKSMLDKMFPQNGASVPEIRFKGFTDPWEQRKVGTLIEDYTEKTVTQNQYPVLTSSQQQGIVLQEDYFADRQVTTDNNVGYYVLPKGYFTYRSRSDTDVFVFNRNNIVDKGIISYYYPVFAPKSCDSNFLLRRLNHGIKKQLSMAAEGTGQKVLAHAKFKNMVVDVPSQSEQEKIGTILEELDTLITLHQRKLEKLQNIKKSCLEKMFV